MSDKQKKHLEKARISKANKHLKINNSSDVLTLINSFIKQIDFKAQAQGNNAPNTLNALISYYKVLKEEENNQSGEDEYIQKVNILMRTIEREAINKSGGLNKEQLERRKEYYTNLGIKDPLQNDPLLIVREDN